MNNLKTNPVGIDSEIERIQIKLYESLISWGIDGFGRVYINDNNTPLWFYKKNDYKLVLTKQDSTNGKFFFVESGTTEIKTSISLTEVDLIFLLDLSKIKPNITHRADEEVKVDIERILRKHLTRQPLKIIKGKGALNGFTTKLKDLHPYSFLKFTFQVRYNNNC